MTDCIYSSQPFEIYLRTPYGVIPPT